MTKNLYEIGIVENSNVDTKRNVMLLIRGRGIEGKFHIKETVFLRREGAIFRVEVGNLKFPKGLDGGLFLHGKILGELPLPEDFDGFSVLV